MKKILKLSVIVLFVMCMFGKVYASNECKLSIVTTKNEYSKDEQIIVEVKMSNINTRAGVMAIGGVVEYDKTSLKLEKIEGQNGWSPYINEQTGRFVAERNAPNKKDEIIFKLTFSINEGSKKNLSITIKEIQVGDGTTLYTEIDDAKKEISIKEKTNNIPTSNPTSTTTPTSTSTPTSKTTNNPTVSPTIKPSETPTDRNIISNEIIDEDVAENNDVNNIILSNNIIQDNIINEETNMNIQGTNANNNVRKVIATTVAAVVIVCLIIGYIKYKKIRTIKL